MNNIFKIVNFLICFVILMFTLFVIDFWVKFLFPALYTCYFSNIGIYSVFNLIGIWIYFFTFIIFLLIISNILNVKNSVKYIIIFDFIFYILLVYLTYEN